MASPLTPEAILSQFEALVQDTLDQTTEMFLLNLAKDTIEGERSWAILTGLDQSQIANSGDTFQTPKTLPADFFYPSPRGIYVGTDLIKYNQIPFESNIDFQAITYAYFIDYYNKKFYMCGTTSRPGTIQFFYRRSSPTLALGNSPAEGTPWIFPAQFHPLLVFEMAVQYFAIDQGEKARSWDDRWTAFATRIRDNMTSWDDQLQSLPLQNELNMFVDPSSFPTIIDMGGGNNGGAMFG